MAVHYVDAAVATSGDGNSWQQAWKSFANINWSAVLPGDTVFISGGTYTGELTVGASGTVSAQITISNSAEAGHNGTVTIDRNGGADGVVLNGWNYVTVQGLNVSNISDAGFSVRSSLAGIVIVNDSVYSGDPGGGNARGYDVRNSSGVILRGDSFSTPTNTQAQTDGIYSQNNNGNVYEGNRIVIANSNTNGHSDDFQSLQDANLIVRGNLFQQANSATFNNHGAWISDGQTGGTVQFYNNVVLTPSLTSDSAVTDYNETSWTGTGAANIWNNTIIGGNRAVNLAGANLAKVQNNIIEPASGGFGVVILPGTAISGSSITNNLIWAPGASIANVNNVTMNWSQFLAAGYNSGGVNADPLFVSSGNYSHCIAHLSPEAQLWHQLRQEWMASC